MTENLPTKGNLLRCLAGSAAPPHGKKGIDIEALLAAKRKPDLWARGVDLFWDDPHISQQMLKAHLDPETDRASRRPETIDRIVRWLVEALSLSPGRRIVDLGCGPGLYTECLARLGMDVTGVDFSRNSLAYAREKAEAAGLPITYLYKDYRTLDYQEEFDLALMIYYDLGALSDHDRDVVLHRVHAALRPGGRFVFDVLTQAGRERARRVDGWEPSEGGFWRPGPHIVITDTFAYLKDHAELDQYLVIEGDGSYSLYRVWSRYYDLAEITRVLERAGFAVEASWADLTGRPIAAGGTNAEADEGIAIVARKMG